MKRNLFSWTWICALLWSAPALAGPQALDFFKAPESAFPSGQASLESLQKFALREHLRSQFLAEKDGMRFWIEPNEFVRDIDLSFRVLDLSSKSTYWLLSIEPGKSQGRNEGTGKVEALAMENLVPQSDDLGVVIPLTPTSLRKNHEWKSEFVLSLPALSRLKLLGAKGNWLLVSPLDRPELKGWLEASGPLTKFDFALHVLPEGGTWVAVKHRESGVMITENGQRIPLEKLRGIITDPDLGITSVPLHSLGLPRRASLKISKGRSREWVESSLPGHGRVFWRRPSNNIREENPAPMTVLSTEGLLRRAITSVAFHPQKPSIGVASADGVFISHDGFVWQQVRGFEKKNFPVAINTEGHFFVGPYRSTDSGQSFQPFLKWEKISALSANSSSYRHHPILRLIQIEPLPKNRVRIGLNNGLKTWTMTGDTKYGLVQDWKLE